jgi:hypothetical protein
VPCTTRVNSGITVPKLTACMAPEPEGSSRQTQEPATGPYPEPQRIRPVPRMYEMFRNELDFYGGVC